MSDDSTTSNPSATPAANAAIPPHSAGGAEDLFLRLHHWLFAQPVIWLFLITFAVVAYLNPAKVGLLFWGITKLAAFGYAGDWIDARIFPAAQPKVLEGIAEGTAWKRKGLIVAASIVAGAMLP